MNRFVILLLAIGYSSANFCTDSTGHWFASLAEGVTDYAYGGSRLNNKYYCFEGCLNTGTALQNYKIDLAGTNATMLERSRPLKEIVYLHAQPKIRDDDDPNAEFCVDPVLRQDIANALQKTTQNSCKNIVNTLVLNLNRPGWAITCIQFDEFALDGVISDKNFCSYDAVQNNEIYTIRLGKLDMS
ncbi:Protein CBG02857 [Caenorhabditis briggsae]|uniref:Uncharacterized protein n=2 Tax=Caenorhabditis briggsae TaxID=6238 RepID=A0AAE9DLJ3_CAEBR|nr:Protein CBG02857 [Caenorhabditis briggsae]ULU06213.1 hypothetical protein L3Y34_018231 [Caenorhabditis briggsae]UMM18162.1 hypothetical protein L5515_014354 [Caenorhabditis briggsae]CAP23742.1 Protein CBG02857 [Caenorhabditis briggsae]